MKLTFYKFDGAGNDFILLDTRKNDPRLEAGQIARLCHRRFGIGADGLMTLGEKEGYDFEMRYYNSDGHMGSMCGNGGRCITAFAKMLEIAPTAGDMTYCFEGYDGVHYSRLLAWDGNKGNVTLKMRDVEEIVPCLDGWYLNTGSPHYVEMVKHLDHYDVFGKGRTLRNDKATFPKGVNVDFIEPHPDGTLRVRTYERGVEDETYSCGTGITASAIVFATRMSREKTQESVLKKEEYAVRLSALGGDFEVSFRQREGWCEDVFLTGPVSCNFKGEFDLNSLSQFA
ncbi:MAG: diaminopimelate epimerase [Bacteroidales bacterium]|nr:diaminopimelate epimerase [Bacteroidales bacterium]